MGGARPARREERAYREYVSDEQRSPAGCIGGQTGQVIPTVALSACKQKGHVGCRWSWLGPQRDGADHRQPVAASVEVERGNLASAAALLDRLLADAPQGQVGWIRTRRCRRCAPTPTSGFSPHSSRRARVNSLLFLEQKPCNAAIAAAISAINCAHGETAFFPVRSGHDPFQNDA